jgi:hypothetical protein
MAGRSPAGRLFAALLIFAVIVAAAGYRRASPPPPNVSRLIADLKSPDLRRREASAVALERVQPLPPEAIDALAEAVKAEEAIRSANPNDGLQFYALQALSNAGAPAIPALAALTKSENQLTRARAIQALGRAGLHDPRAWPILISAFKGASHDTAAQELGKLGPPVLPLLRESLKDHDPTRARGRCQGPRADGEFRSDSRAFRSARNRDRHHGGLCQCDARPGRGVERYGRECARPVSDGVYPVEIESPERWYKDKLGPREAIRRPGGNFLNNGAIGFAFSIWNANDPECCPTAGLVVGTYKVIKEMGTSVGLGTYVPGTGLVVRANPARRLPTTTWKMVVDTAKREPMPRPAQHSQ